MSLKIRNTIVKTILDIGVISNSNRSYRLRFCERIRQELRYDNLKSLSG